jgi:hypothetical protein
MTILLLAERASKCQTDSMDTMKKGQVTYWVEWSAMLQDFTTLLRMMLNLKLKSCLYLEFST